MNLSWPLLAAARPERLPAGPRSEPEGHGARSAAPARWTSKLDCRTHVRALHGGAPLEAGQGRPLHPQTSDARASPRGSVQTGAEIELVMGSRAAARSL